MKTPMQELIETFEEMNTGYKPTIDVSLALSFMRSMLEKEKEVIETAFLEGRILRPLDSEQWYNETFNTK